MEFPIPEGFVPPEHLDSDDQFQAMCTLELVNDSTLKLVDVEGYQVGEEDTEKDTGQAEDVEAKNAAAALQAAGAGAGGAQGTQPGPGIAPAMQGAGAGAGAAAAGGPPGAGAPPGPIGPGAPTAPFAQELGRRFRQMTGRR